MTVRARPAYKTSAVAVIVAAGSVLRVWNLGNASFQNDETTALFLPEPGEGLLTFLLKQRRGPLQHVTTYLIGFVDPGFRSEMLDRLPFAIAGSASIWFFYRFVEMHFGWRVSVFATAFYATNGLLVALSRVVQYQGLVMLLTTMTLYFLSRASRDQRYQQKGLMLGFLCWGLSILAHIDGLLILPLVIYLLREHRRRYRSPGAFRLPAFMLATMTLAFYVPFALSIDDETWDYWMGRLLGQDKPGSSFHLFAAYNPIYAAPFYLLTTALGVGYLIRSAAKRQQEERDVFLILWLVGAFVVFEGLVRQPGTHIYNYLIPLTVLMGLGASFAWDALFAWPAARVVGAVALGGGCLFLWLQSYAVFVDDSDGYPWQDERFLLWTIARAEPHQFYGSMMGFPYQRRWDEVGREAARQGVSYFITNDRANIGGFYMRPAVWNARCATWYIAVRDQQSFRSGPPPGRIADWVRGHGPTWVIKSRGRPVSAVYDLPRPAPRSPRCVSPGMRGVLSLMITGGRRDVLWHPDKTRALAITRGGAGYETIFR